MARGDGLRARRLPAGARERVLGLRRERAEADGDDRPGDHDEPDVAGRPAAETSDRADRGHRVTSREKHGVAEDEDGHAPTSA